MKNLLFGLMATVLLSNLSYGQKNDPSNSKNEFDYVGKIHNESLLKIVSIKNEADLFKQNPTAYIINELKNNDFETETYLEVVNNKNVIAKLGELDYNKLEFSDNYIEDLYKANLVNDKTKSFLHQINILILKLEKDNDYDNFKIEMVKLEETANDLKEADRVFILSVSSLARYSYSFWINFSLTNNSPFARGGAGRADLAGAVAGGVRTLVICAISGPVGWTVWAGSIIGGGLGGSAAYYIINW